MLKKLLTILSLFLPLVVFAATNDFVANSNITVPGVTFGAGTADMLILSGSQSESWTFSSGTFTITNPGTFQVGSSDSTVKSIQVTQGGTTLVCSENSTPGGHHLRRFRQQQARTQYLHRQLRSVRIYVTRYPMPPLSILFPHAARRVVTPDTGYRVPVAAQPVFQLMAGA